MKFVSVLITSLICLAPVCASADDLQDAIATYNDAMDASDRSERVAMFRRAQNLFQKVAQETPNGSAELYANLGNAALQADNLGAAVVAYRTALALDPAHRKAKTNLQFIRANQPDWIRPRETKSLADSIFFWRRFFPKAVLANLAAANFLIMAILASASIYWEKPVLRSICLIPGFVWLILLTSTYVVAWENQLPNGVIISEVVGRTADSISSAARFRSPLPNGTEVRIAESREGWSRVLIANDQSAWVPSATVEFVP